MVLGAGSAGSVIARRLSDDPGLSVGLVEAGGFPADPDIDDPLQWPALPGRAFDWAYRTEPQPHTADRCHDWPRGRLVGGSSCMHAMAHVRGHPEDFEPWRHAGGDRWSYASLLPAFTRSESFSGGDTSGRGTDGPLDVILPDDAVSPVVRAYMAAGNALGAPELGDHNRGRLNGTAPNSLTLRNGRRLSVATAYLDPQILARDNLTLLTEHRVDRLLIEGPRATGILARHTGQPVTLTADRIVICAGAIASPMLLMRSGIGSADTLRQIGVDCRFDSPEVGRNLQDHLLVLGNVYRARQSVPPSRLQHSESLMYLDSSDLSARHTQPDIVLACVVAPSAAPGFETPPYGTAYTLLCGVTHPASRGVVKPGSADPDQPPLIDPHYLSTDHDRATFRTALQLARQLGHHKALEAWRDCEVLPGADMRSDAELDAFIARTASTHHHPCGTCRMGRDETAVVDPDLRINGLGNAFIVDASIMPAIPSGPINAAVVAIAEHWAAGLKTP
nr:GMC family oxidoreductase N-terminal domain-containing protein [Pseudohoeflea sp. DP4N28-3]